MYWTISNCPQQKKKKNSKHFQKQCKIENLTSLKISETLNKMHIKPPWNHLFVATSINHQQQLIKTNIWNHISAKTTNQIEIASNQHKIKIPAKKKKKKKTIHSADIPLHHHYFNNLQQQQQKPSINHIFTQKHPILNRNDQNLTQNPYISKITTK
jgi:predicted component of viral defense system (DUF524 family)